MANVTYIRPKKRIGIDDARELWTFRELFYFFTWRDLKVRYKQTIIGAAWAVFQPFMTMVVFSIFFGQLAKMPSDGVPYPIFVYTGLIFWQFFSNSLNDVSSSLVGNQSIITKVYFPRLIIPISSVVTNFVDFSIAAVILAGMMIYYHIVPSAMAIAVIPLGICISFMCAVGCGLFLAAANVKYRDVRYVLPYFIQLLIFLTPVIYPASITGKYSKILAINPMTGVIQSVRAVLLGTTEVNWTLISLSLIACLVFFVIGIYAFKKVERYFADVV